MFETIALSSFNFLLNYVDLPELGLPIIAIDLYVFLCESLCVDTFFVMVFNKSSVPNLWIEDT